MLKTVNKYIFPKKIYSLCLSNTTLYLVIINRIGYEIVHILVSYKNRRERCAPTCNFTSEIRQINLNKHFVSEDLENSEVSRNISTGRVAAESTLPPNIQRPETLAL